MSAKLLSLVCLFVAFEASLGQENKRNLPELFSFSQPTHNVAVFRGADLKKAIAAGLVPGFGSLQKTPSAADSEDREGRSDDSSASDASSAEEADSAADPDATAADADAKVADADSNASYIAAETPTTQAPTTAPKAYTPAPIVYKPAPVAYKPAPLVYRPAPTRVVYKPAPAPVVYKPAPAPVVYKPAPAPVVYKPAPAPVVVKPTTISYKPTAPAASYQPYVDPYPAEEALYTYEYAVKDDYSGNDFGAKEARDGYLTNGQYNVALPDGRLQTVTYTVNGGEGYVADIQYVGEPQYPALVAPTYSS